MELRDAQERVGRILENVTDFVGTKRDRGWEKFTLGPDQFPVPELILFALRDLHGLTAWGPGEKLRWGVTVDYRGTPFSVTLEKFGPRLYMPQNTPVATKERVIEELVSVTRIAEAHLRDVASQQIQTGNVTIENKYNVIDNRYIFFRERADEAYKSRAPKFEALKGSDGEVFGWSGHPFRPQIEGGYFAGAMIDAYFSRLEHLLVLALPFTNFDPSANALVEFVGKTWGDKWKSIFDLSENGEAKKVYERLLDVKETVRNPLAHGGFGKRGTSFFFHVENVGALPALLSRRDVGSEISITPVPENSFTDICACFDATDSFLRETMGPSVEFAKTGLDIALSENFRAKCCEASQSPEDLLAFIEGESYKYERHVNMDY